VPSIHYIDLEGAVAVYEYQYPKDIELLDIFPEAKTIIPQALRAWRKVKRDLIITETEPYLRLCNALTDPFAAAFWKEAYSYLAGGFKASCLHVSRLERLQAILKDPAGARASKCRIDGAKLIPIASLYAFQGLRRSGHGYIARCPIHAEHTASFRIYPDNSWHCFGCGRGGDAISFVRELHGLSFIRAVNYILGGEK